jgi:hypothetical protein
MVYETLLLQQYCTRHRTQNILQNYSLNQNMIENLSIFQGFVGEGRKRGENKKIYENVAFYFNSARYYII